ncbi:MAG: hypothetical protein V2A55_01515 [Candidatus Jorgensenbacteria bacterium]
MTLQLAGYLSGIAIILSFLPYIRDIFRDKTKPERASWLIWTILGLISLFSQLAKGATWSSIMTGAQAAGDALIFLLALKYGLGGLQKRDIAGLTGAAIGLVLWGLTGEAAVALFIVIFVDAIGVALTVIKTYKYPSTETVSSWVLTFLGGLFACVAVGRLDFVLLAFPFYICLASVFILISIWLGFRH